MHVAVIDIGKPGRSLGWSMAGPRTAEGTDIDQCVAELTTVLRDGPVALGFEAPMFVPLRQDAANLLAARIGECGEGIANRPFSAGAGPTALVTALVVVPYVLSRLRAGVPDAKATLNWQSPACRSRELLLFEAFVANQQNPDDTRHVQDARLAVAAFQRGMQDPARFESSVVEPTCLSLLGAMLLRTGWTEDVAILSEPCLVVRV